MAITASISVPPCPPSASGMVMPSSRCFAMSFATSHGYPGLCARSSALPDKLFFEKRSTASRNCSCSGVKLKFIGSTPVGPGGGVRGERYRRRAPVWRRPGKLHHRAQIADPARRRVHLCEQRPQLILRKILGNLPERILGQHAAVRDPFADAGERHAHQPAAALARAARKRDRGAEGHQVAAHIVDRRDRQGFWRASFFGAMPPAAYGLPAAREP